MNIELIGGISCVIFLIVFVVSIIYYLRKDKYTNIGVGFVSTSEEANNEYARHQQEQEDKRIYNEYSSRRIKNETERELKYVIFIIDTFEKFEKTFMLTDEYVESMKPEYEKYLNSRPTFLKNVYHTLKCFTWLKTYEKKLILSEFSVALPNLTSAYMIYDRDTAKYWNNNRLSEDFEKEYYV